MQQYNTPTPHYKDITVEKTAAIYQYHGSVLKPCQANDNPPSVEMVNYPTNYIRTVLDAEVRSEESVRDLSSDKTHYRAKLSCICTTECLLC